MGKTTFDRAFLKTQFPDLIRHIQANHVMGPEIERELFINNNPVEGLCHQRGYFIVITGGIYMQYVMDHVITNVELRLIGRSVQEVTVYDNYQEYEADRVRAMMGVKASDQTGINMN